MASPVHQEMNSSLLSALTLNREIMVSPVHQEMNLPLLAAPMLWLCHLLTKRWTHHCYQLWHGAVIHSPRDELTTAISTDMVVSSAGRDWLIIAIGITHSTQRPADRQWWVICRQRLTHHSNRNHTQWVICRQRLTHHSNRNHTQRPADRQWQVICRQPTHHWRNHRTDSPTVTCWHTEQSTHRCYRHRWPAQSWCRGQSWQYPLPQIPCLTDSPPFPLPQMTAHQGFRKVLRDKIQMALNNSQLLFFHAIFKDLLKRENSTRKEQLTFTRTKHYCSEVGGGTARHNKEQWTSQEKLLLFF